MSKRSDIVWEARQWLGVRFRHQGRSRAGLDCAGLICKVGVSTGLMLADERAYDRRPDAYTLLSLMDKNLVKTTKKEPELGDVMLFAFYGLPQHLAIATDIGMIHAYADARCVVEHHYDKTWQDRLVYVYEYAGVK